jgi:hypothetical protein
MFKEGRTNVKDDPRLWRPISSTSEKGICNVKALINEDVRYTLEVTCRALVRHM